MFQSKLFNGNSISCIVDGVVYTVDDSHPMWDNLKQSVKDNNSEEFVKNVNIRNILNAKVEGVNNGLSVSDDGSVSYNGSPVEPAIQDLINRNLSEGFDVNSIVKFLDRLYNCSSFNTRKHLFNFLQNHKLTITEDGCFLAYKCVKDNYLDKYSGTISNKIGEVVKIDRSKVDDNPSNHCSSGLHVGALAYSGPGGWYHSEDDKVIIVKVDPINVISVPTDHSFTKMRVCEYTVVGDYKGELNRSVYSGKITDDELFADEYNDEELDEDDEELIRPEEVLRGYSYSAQYKGVKDMMYKTRYFLVKDKTDDYIIGELLYPEEEEGQVRCFHFDRFDGDCLEYDE